MVATAARQPGYRPETIRTRLARFMPRGAAAAWSAGWSSQTQRAAEISSDDELNVSEHLGCYASAVSHALAKAEMAPVQLRLQADAKAAAEALLQVITLEIRGTFRDGAIDESFFQSVVARVEPSCPIWRQLAADSRLRVVPMVEQTTAASAARAEIPAPVVSAAPQPAKSWSVSHQIRVPRWLSARAAVLITVALALLAFVPHLGVSTL